MFRIPDDAEKKEVWKAYRERRPVRVPLRWNVNARIILLNPALNPEGYTFRQYFNEPRVTLTVQSRLREYIAAELSRSSDAESALPEQWAFGVDCQNIYDAAYFGAEVHFEDGQVPGTRDFLTEAEVGDFLRRDFSRPLENPWIRENLRYQAALAREAESFTHLGRRGTVRPFNLGFDGPLTVAANLFGTGIFALLGEDPARAAQVMETITRAVIVRNRALAEANGGWTRTSTGGLADDSIQLIGTDTLVRWILPLYELWYAEMSTTTPRSGGRSMHLCGDATRHFPVLHEQAGMDAFDTGFPVDHGALRKALGPDVEISGGPPVALLLNGTPADCHREATRLLESGVKEGGRFILQEGNNLPPRAPPENLRAVYQACLESGGYEAS